LNIGRGQFKGFQPNLRFRDNSGYMADYVRPLSRQIKDWMENDSLISKSRQKEHIQSYTVPRLRFKTTIEPS